MNKAGLSNDEGNSILSLLMDATGTTKNVDMALDLLENINNKGKEWIPKYSQFYIYEKSSKVKFKKFKKGLDFGLGFGLDLGLGIV